MRLTGKDGVTSVTMAVITAAYLAFLFGASMLIIDTVRGTITTVLVLGMVCGCVFAGLATGETTKMDRFLIGLASLFGAVALTAAIVP